jgi:hypothetical protein
VSDVERWLSRWAPLASIPAAVLLIVAISSGGNNSPNNNATAAQVVRYYTTHASGQKVSAITGTLAFVFLMFFMIALSGRVRARGAGGWLANGVVAGAALAVMGFLPLLTFSFILGNDIRFMRPATAQTLNILNDDYFLPTVAGFVILGIVAGLAVIVSRAPARWMGWVLFAVGVLAAVPPLSFFAFMAIFLWALIAGIWLVVKDRAPVQAEPREPSLTAA